MRPPVAAARPRSRYSTSARGPSRVNAASEDSASASSECACANGKGPLNRGACSSRFNLPPMLLGRLSRAGYSSAKSGSIGVGTGGRSFKGSPAPACRPTREDGRLPLWQGFCPVRGVRSLRAPSQVMRRPPVRRGVESGDPLCGATRSVLEALVLGRKPGTCARNCPRERGNSINFETQPLARAQGPAVAVTARPCTGSGYACTRHVRFAARLVGRATASAFTKRSLEVGTTVTFQRPDGQSVQGYLAEPRTPPARPRSW